MAKTKTGLTQFARRNRRDYDDSNAAANNVVGEAIIRSRLYNVTREAIIEKHEDLGLVKCKLANIFRASEKIVEKDLESRKKCCDDSTNCLGILRRCRLGHNCVMYLYGKISHLYAAELS